MYMDSHFTEFFESLSIVASNIINGFRVAKLYALLYEYFISRSFVTMPLNIAMLAGGKEEGTYSRNM